MKIYTKSKHKIILSILICTIIFSSVLVASAADMTYYWTPSIGTIDSSGFTANWGICNAKPTSYKITNLSNIGSGCNSDYLTITSAGPQFLAIFPTAYSSDTPITGKANATFVLGGYGSYAATYRFELGYAQGGIFYPIGSVVQQVPSAKLYNIDMSGISGIAPSGSYLALKVSITSSYGGRIYLGTNAGVAGSNSGRFNVTEGSVPANGVPVANDQSVTTDENVAVGITLTGSDPDPGDVLTYIVVTNPTHGTLSGMAPSLTYTPTNGYNGSDSFTFKVNDSKADSNVATVSITVNVVVPGNQPPIANDQAVVTDENVAKVITLTGSDPDNDPLTYIVVTNPAHGTLSGVAPSLTYTPNTNFNGSDSFTFKVNDSKADSNIATVSITVNAAVPVNRPPVANDQSVTTDENVAKAITLTGSDPDNDPLTYIVVTQPVNGTLSGTAPSLTYTPNTNFNGSDSFTFKVNDSKADSNVATVSITVNATAPVNRPPVANDQSGIITIENTPISITLTGSDPDGDPLTYIVVTNPAHGSLSGTAPDLTYTPSTGYNGPDSFTFKVNDSKADSNVATVSITVNPALPVSTAGPRIILEPNRYVVLDDSNQGTAAQGFYNPSNFRGGSWESNYWSGESTTIRSVATVLNETPQSGVSVTFTLKMPNGTVGNTVTATTDSKGMAYYSYNLNNKNYWGYWKIESTAAVNGVNVIDNKTFALYYWGCTQCHGSESPGKWGTIYTPKSYYTMGYDFHKSSSVNKHIEPMTKGNCATCHQMYNGVVINRGYTDDSPPIYNESEYTPDWHNGKVKCEGCHSGSNLSKAGSNTGQGKNPEIAGCYDTAGCHAKKNNNLMKVNSTTGYVIGGTYRTKYSNISASAKAHNGSDSVPCIDCHNAGHNIQKPYNDVTTSNTNTENDQCWACHSNRETSHMESTNCVSCHSQNAHRVSSGAGGGPDCVGCHNDTGGLIHRIDPSAMTNSIHSTLNDGAPATVSAENKKCWACHGNASQPVAPSGGQLLASAFYSPGYENDCKRSECHGRLFAASSAMAALANDPGAHTSNYKTPYTCEDCHITHHGFATTNQQCLICHGMHGGNMYKMPYVQQHYKGGIDIRAAEIAVDNTQSCLLCHNKTEMKVPYVENDQFRSAASEVAHYGKNRSDIRFLANGAGYISTSCTYCHENTSTAFVGAMQNINHSNMSNHSDSINTPQCYTCHGVGKIHDKTTPWSTPTGLTIPTLSDPYCKGCHSNKQNHNTTVTCFACHMKAGDTTYDNVGGQIHGIKYMNNTGSYLKWDTTNAVNCADCHMNTGTNTGVLSALSGWGLTAPGISSSMLNHSRDNGGQKWGNYWGTQSGACVYCHNDSKHSNDAFGKARSALGGSPIGDAIGSGTVCSSCHAPSDAEYGTMMNLLEPDPVADQPGSPAWNPLGVDHAGYGVTDVDCQACHGGLLSTGATMSEFLHNVDVGMSGGPNCVSCHDANKNGAPVRVNSTVISTSAHRNLNGAETDINNACYACHSNGVIPTSGHPDGYDIPKNCTDCHTGTGNFSAPLIAEHSQVATGIITNSATCNSCHNNSGMYLPADVGKNVHYIKEVTNLATTPYGHSGPIDTSDCKQCHLGVRAGSVEWGYPPDISSSSILRPHPETETAQCNGCHNKNKNVFSLTTVDFHNASLKTISGAGCTGCHAEVDTTLFKRHANLNTTDGVGIVSDSDCAVCHHDSNMPMTLGAANSSNTYFCGACHTTAGTGPVKANKTTDPKLVKDTLNHAKANCEWCHIAGNDMARPLDVSVKYHTGGPNGTANDETCKTCHLNYNLQDLPFNPPGVVHTAAAINSCGSSCHNGPTGYPVNDIHSVKYLPGSTPPKAVLTIPVVNPDNVTISATITDQGSYLLMIAAVQYNVTDSAGATIVGWTGMTTDASGYNSYKEIVTTIIGTTGWTAGTYTINVKGMSSGPHMNDTARSLPYYPLNGQWSVVVNKSFVKI